MENAVKLYIHYSLDGRRPQLETCRAKKGTVTTDLSKATCPRCRVAFGIAGDLAIRNRIRRGFLTSEQLQQLLRGASKWPCDHAAVLVAYYCALRATEVGNIRMENVDLKNGRIDIARLKGSLSGVYELAPIMPVLSKWLKVRPKLSPWLFPKKGKPALPLDRRHFYAMVRRAGKIAGLPVELCHPHVLKHSIATHMLERGDDLTHVREWMGHKRMENTLIYAELTGRKKKEGADVAASLVGGIL